MHVLRIGPPLVLWFVGGLLLSIAVSWRQALYSNVSEPMVDPAPNTPLPTERFSTLYGLGVTYTSGYFPLATDDATRDYVQRLLDGKGAELATRPWDDIVIPDQDVRAYFTIQESGWPLRDLYSVTWIFHSLEAQPAGQFDVHLGRNQYFSSIAAPAILGDAALRRRLPIGVHVFNLLVNSILMATALFLTWRTAKWTVRHIMRKARPGHCTHCGYDTSNLKQCPECGEPVSQTSTHTRAE